MWRPRDRERFIGGYDPEHEMPDPDRDRGDRWQSDIYRHNSRDSRFAYRFNPDRFEDRFGNRDRYRGDYDVRWNHDARDVGPWSSGPRSSGPRGYGGYGEYSDYDRGYDRGYDFNRGGYDRGYDFDDGWNRGRYPEDRGPRPEARWGGSDYDRAMEFGGRGYERDWRDRQRFERDRGYRGSEFNDDDYDRWRRR